MSSRGSQGRWHRRGSICTGTLRIRMHHTAQQKNEEGVPGRASSLCKGTEAWRIWFGGKQHAVKYYQSIMVENNP